MSEILAFLQSFVTPTLPKAALLTIVGSLFLAGLWLGTWPFSLFDNGVTLFATLATAWGCGSFGYIGVEYGLREIAMRKAASAQATKDAIVQNRDDENAQANLDILEGPELVLLIWLLRKGDRRFVASLRNSSLRGLWSKGLLAPPTGSLADDVWLIRESVWSRKSEILLRHSSVRTENDMPSPGWMA